MGQSPFVRVQVSRSSVYLQEPFRVTITVLTPTWFTAPPDFNKLEIPGSFILPFDQTVPGMFDVAKNKYAGIQFYYIVFPYKSGRYTVPPFTIEVMSPAAGTAIARKWTLRSAEIPFFVKDIPASDDRSYWMVAKNVFIRESWSVSLRHLKVGDVIERTDIIDARGTLPQFIPEIPMADPAWASVYPKDPILKDQRNDAEANGVREQKKVYLLEKEGVFDFPAFTVYWWNPQLKRMLSRTTKSVRVTVAKNPNLGILETVRDSLSSKTISNKTKENTPKTIAGIIWYRFLLFILTALIALYFLIRMSFFLYRKLKKEWEIYKQSELYWFRKFKKSGDNGPMLIRNFYHWWDRRKDPGKASVGEGIIAAEGLLSEWEKIEKSVFCEIQEKTSGEKLKKQAILFRHKKEQTAHKMSNDIQDEWYS